MRVAGYSANFQMVCEEHKEVLTCGNDVDGGLQAPGCEVALQQKCETQRKEASL